MKAGYALCQLLYRYVGLRRLSLLYFRRCLVIHLITPRCLSFELAIVYQLYAT